MPHFPIKIPAAALFCAAAACDAAAQCVEPRGLFITEVFYDGPTADEGLEWVELRNDAGTTIQLTGQYSLGWGGTTYLFGQLDLQGSIAPGETFVVGGPLSNADNGSPIYQQSVSVPLTIQNSGATADGVALFDVPAASVTANTAPMDSVIYGDINDNNLAGPGGAIIPPHVGDAPAGSSIELTTSGWQIQPAPMPNLTSLAPPLSPLAISEVFYDAPTADTDLEWIELYNRGALPIALTGNYSIGYGGTDYTFGQHDLQGVVQPGATFVVGGPVSSADNAFPVLDQLVSLALQNAGATADGLALFDLPMSMVDGLTIPVDTVIYGGSNDNMLIDSSGTAPAPDVADAPSGNSIELGLAGWGVLASPTPNVTPLASTGCRAFADGFE